GSPGSRSTARSASRGTPRSGQLGRSVVLGESEKSWQAVSYSRHHSPWNRKVTDHLDPDGSAGQQLGDSGRPCDSVADDQLAVRGPVNPQRLHPLNRLAMPADLAG